MKILPKLLLLLLKVHSINLQSVFLDVTSLFLIIFFYVCVFAGVVSGALTRQIGCRPVVVCGGLLASVSMIAASFSEELWHLYITISLTGKFNLCRWLDFIVVDHCPELR